MTVVRHVIRMLNARQAMGNAFLYYGSLSSCAPNLDIPGLWDLTNACGFPPGDDGPDLVATFHEWDVSGTGEITWNDFVREMTTRINDPGHFNADPLPESIDQISIPDKPLGDGYKSFINSFNASDADYEEFDGNSGAPAPPAAPQAVDMYAAFTDGSWKDVLASVEPECDGEGSVDRIFLCDVFFRFGFGRPPGWAWPSLPVFWW